MPVNSELLRSELVSIGRTRTVGMLQKQRHGGVRRAIWSNTLFSSRKTSRGVRCGLHRIHHLDRAKFTCFSIPVLTSAA